MTIRELKKDYPKLGALAESLMDADANIDWDLDEAFYWTCTPQGNSFWHEVYNEENIQQKEEALSNDSKDEVSIEDVEEHFKNAKTIMWLNAGIEYELTGSESVVMESNHGFHFKIDGSIENSDCWNYIYDIEEGRYADIIEYKERSPLIDKIEEAVSDIQEEYKNKDNFKEITSSIASLLEYKNKKYGNSALDPINVFKGKTKLGQRLDDKISRVKNSETLAKNDVADIIGYLILVCEENNWKNFDEFKD